MVKWTDHSLTGWSVTSLHRRTYYWSHTLRFRLLTNIPSHFKETLYIYLFVIYFQCKQRTTINFSNVSKIHCELNTLSSLKYNLNHSIHLLFILVFVSSTESNLEHCKHFENIERILLWVRTQKLGNIATTLYKKLSPSKNLLVVILQVLGQQNLQFRIGTCYNLDTEPASPLLYSLDC